MCSTDNGKTAPGGHKTFIDPLRAQFVFAPRLLLPLRKFSPTATTRMFYSHPFPASWATTTQHVDALLNQLVSLSLSRVSFLSPTEGWDAGLPSPCHGMMDVAGRNGRSIIKSYFYMTPLRAALNRGSGPPYRVSGPAPRGRITSAHTRTG